MKPLLKIQSIPISIEYQTTRAALKQNTEPPRVNITRQRGTANIRTTPARVQIDTYEARASAGMKSPARSIREFAQNGMEAAREATRAYAEEGNTLLDAHGKGSPIADIAASKIGRTLQTGLTFMPSERPVISTQPASISFDYQMDKLTFDWNINDRPQLEFVPPNIEFSVKQYPALTIEYVGSPHYVPASADPEYVPIPGIDENA